MKTVFAALLSLSFVVVSATGFAQTPPASASPSTAHHHHCDCPEHHHGQHAAGAAHGTVATHDAAHPAAPAAAHSHAR